MERILFLTGRLAHDSLCRELGGLSQRAFDYHVHDLGIKVAALMSTELIRRRLTDTFEADRILVPGLCTGPVESLSQEFGIPVARGPKDLMDLAEFFGTEGRKADLSQHSVTIFAEIVDAPQLEIEAIVARAERYRTDGADVIDLGCLPETPFPHLEDAIGALQEAGLQVSVDSLDTEDLLRAGRAGADYLLSLKESTLWLAEEVAATPVLIPEQGGDLDSLCRASESLHASGKTHYVDAILEPIHFGLTESIVRYHTLRQRLPETPIMMGTGNLTELTDADSMGVTAVLMGLVSELGGAAILTTEVSPHCVSAVREADLARRVMHAAKADGRLPRGYHAGMMALHERKPFPRSSDDIAAAATAIKDANFRIQVSADGLHVFNRDGLRSATDPLALYSELGVEHDGSHAFYLGLELARAQIAWHLGKRYLQDNPLDWGVALAVEAEDLDQGYRPPASTRRQRSEKKSSGTKPANRPSKG